MLMIRRSEPEWGGIENQVLQIAAELNRRNLLRPILLTTHLDTPFVAKFRMLGLQAHQVRIDGIKPFLSLNPAIAALIEEYDVRLMQSHMFRESMIARAIKQRHPKLKHVYRVHTYVDCSQISEGRKRAYHLLDRLTSSMVDLYLPISETVRCELHQRAHIPAHRTKLVKEGVPSLGEADLVEHGPQPLPRKLAMVSNLVPGKGVEVLIEALALLAERGIRLEARIIGENSGARSREYFRKIHALAIQKSVLDQIDFCGHRDAVAEALSGFPVLALPSDSEGTPNAILEALSLKKLVVASQVGGVPEVIKHEINGLLHPPKNAGALADILEQVFRSPSSRWLPLREASFRTWQEEHSLDAMMNDLIAVYRELGVI